MMIDKEEKERKEIEDLLGAIAFLDYLESRRKDSKDNCEDAYARMKGTRSDGDDFVCFIFFGIVALMLMYFELGTTGIGLFASGFIVLLYILYKTTITIGDIVKVSLGLVIIFSVLFSIENNSINKFESQLSSKLYIEEWNKGDNGVEYLFTGLDYPLTLPFSHGDEEVEKIIYKNVSSYNERAFARKANRESGFYVVDNYKADKIIEIYYVGKRVIVVSDNVPERLMKDIRKELKARNGKQFDCKTYKAKKENKLSLKTS